jgi:CO/xanthine dehydrogenase FAD-binding subunit
MSGASESIPPFVRPTSLASALSALAACARAGKKPVLLAGGTDWMVERHLVPSGSAPPPAPPVIDITALDELLVLERKPHASGRSWFEIGASVPYLTFRRDAALTREVPLLGAMAREVGAIQIQARGTLGGNLATASPAADGVCALAALDVEIELASEARGKRRVKLTDFFTGYKKTVMAGDELITRVAFLAPGPKWYWRKVGTRLAQAISKVALAATAQIEAGTVRDAHFGVASVGPVTATLPNVRAEIVGKPVDAIDATRVRAALRTDIKPIDDVRSTGDYRLHTAERLVDQFLAGLRSERFQGPHPIAPST